MKFLIIDGKLVRMRNGDFITVPDNYNNEPLVINGKLLTVGGAMVGKKPADGVQLSTPQNVTADGTVVSWDEVENATSYEVIEGGNNVLGTVENPVPSGYTVTLTSWDEQVGSNDGAAVKFNTPPTSENDYDYRTGKLYDDTGLYNASGAKVTQPIIVDEVSKVYVFIYAQYGSASAGGYKLNGGSVEYGGEWNNPAVISLTENSTLSLLHAQD